MKFAFPKFLLLFLLMLVFMPDSKSGICSVISNYDCKELLQFPVEKTVMVQEDETISPLSLPLFI